MILKKRNFQKEIQVKQTFIVVKKKSIEHKALS